MITLLRHRQDIIREEDRAIEFWRPERDIKAKFPYSVRWSNNTRVNHFQRGGGRKKRFQFCPNRFGSVILYFRAIHGHSGETTGGSNSIGQHVDPKRFLPIHFSCGMLFQHALHHCFWIIAVGNSWTRSTNGVLYSR